MIENNTNISSFLRWTGSKRWFIKDHIQKFLPNKFNDYHEPFLGGGSVFFYIKQLVDSNQRKFFLSDTNEQLINVYQQIRDNPEDVINYLKQFKNTKEEYYKIRNSKPRIEAKKAAKFIYLNRTSFNGIYRVNAKGIYNVPYGHRSNVDFITEHLIRNVSKILHEVSFSNDSFETSLQSVKKDDLVFLDPPYTIAHENNGFIEYNQKLFSWDDQEKLKLMIEQIIHREAYFVLTNASHNSIESLYKDIANITILSRPSIVGGRTKTRGIYNEFIIHNF